MNVRSISWIAFFALTACKGGDVDSAEEPNTAPAIASVYVTPSPAKVTDTLVCSWTGYADAEGGTDLSIAQWTVNGSPVGEGATLSGGFSKGDTVACTVTPFDGLDEGEKVTGSTTIENSVATVAVVQVTPDPAAADDTLSCSWSGFDDPDGDIDQSIVTWAVNGINAGTNATLAGAFDGGDTVTCYVTPFDGEHAGEDVSASVVIDNVAPSIDRVTITPDPAFVADTLVCGWEGFEDSDGDADQSSASWSVNGQVVGSGLLLSDAFVGGDLVECTVTPFDGNDAGTARTGLVVIANSAPTITGLGITPDGPGAGDSLTCWWEGYADADGDADASKVEWAVNGTPVGGGPTLVGAFVRDDVVGCTVTPSDGASDGTPMTTSVTIGNAVPSVATVTLTPDPASVHDTLTCAWSGYNDPDGDADASVVNWSVNGLDAGSGPTLSGVFAGRDVVQCTVTPFDGEDAGVGVAAAVEITNAVPSITDVSLSPDPAYGDDVLTCAWSGWSDDDGDTDQTRVSWTVNGVDAGFGVALSGVFGGGDVVQCTATPSDGFDDGTPLTAQLTISNSVPVVSGVTVTPNPAVEADTLTCNWTFTDIDGDADASTVSWRVNGAAVGTGSTLSGGFVAGDSVLCTVNPNDGRDMGDPVSTSITINTPPTVSTATITPDPAGANDMLTCDWDGFSDVDGDSDLSFVSWEINGTPQGASATLAGGFVRDDVVTCLVTPHDGYSAGSDVTVDLTVSNSAPSVSRVDISPPAPSPGDTLTCSWMGYDDPDGDADVSEVAWYVDGTEVGTGPTLSSGFGGNDTITCEVTPYDGFDHGDMVSQSVTAGNTAPYVSTVEITPTDARTNDTLTAVVTGGDDDGDDVIYLYEWYVDLAVLPGENDSTLSGVTAFDKDQLVWVEVTPFDGTIEGDMLASDWVIIDNSPPGEPEVEMGVGGYGDTNSDLVCNVTVEAPDDDPGDSVVNLFSWTVDGMLWSDFDDTIDAADTNPGEVWACTVIPSDGDDIGTPAAAVVTIGTAVDGILVGGTWELAGSPYYFTGEVTIPLLQPITVEEGVTVDGLGEDLVVQGILDVDGVDGDMVTFTDVHVVPSVDATDVFPYTIDVEYLMMQGGSFHPDVGATVFGSVVASDSVFLDLTDPIAITDPVADVGFWGNVFVRSPGITVAVDTVIVDIINNAFADQVGDYAIESRGVTGGGQLNALLNSFVSTDRVALRLAPGEADADMTADSNYFGTTDTGVIDTMIYDIADDATCAGTIVYTPVLTEADAATPDPAPYQ